MNTGQKDAKKEMPCDMLAHTIEAISFESNSDYGVSLDSKHYITKSEACQYDVSQTSIQHTGPELDTYSEKTELEKKFAPKHINGQVIAESYKRLGQLSRSQRVSDCGSFLEFAHELNLKDNSVSEKGKLHNANFCRDRLCPMCNWRRSYKIFGQVSKIMSLISSEYKFLFLTLTVPSVNASELSSTIERLYKSWDLLCHNREFKASVLGFQRIFEITVNSKNETYHPHFHVILAVRKTYGVDNDYISRDKWLEMWQKAYHDNTITQVDIRVAKGKSKSTMDASNKLASAVAEIAKYSVKSSDIIGKVDKKTGVVNNPLSDSLIDNRVDILSKVLANRRLIAYGGVFRDAYKKLNLDDAEDGDLIHLDDSVSPDVALLIVRFGWTSGAYKMFETYTKY